jgi:hypothetical protein
MPVNTDVDQNKKISIQMDVDNMSVAISGNSYGDVSYLGGRSYKTVAELQGYLQDILKQEKVEGLAVSWILQTGNYQLFTIDKPKVAVDEMFGAVKLVLADKVSIPLEQMVIDYTDIPSPTNESLTDKMLVIVANKNLIASVIKLVKSCDLNLTDITASEMAYLELFSYLKKDSAELNVVIRRVNKKLQLLLIKDGFLVGAGILPYLTTGSTVEVVESFMVAISQALFRCQQAYSIDNLDVAVIWLAYSGDDSAYVKSVLSEQMPNEIKYLNVADSIDLASCCDQFDIASGDLSVLGGLLDE